MSSKLSSLFSLVFVTISLFFSTIAIAQDVLKVEDFQRDEIDVSPYLYFLEKGDHDSIPVYSGKFSNLYDTLSEAHDYWAYLSLDVNTDTIQYLVFSTRKTVCDSVIVHGEEVKVLYPKNFVELRNEAKGVYSDAFAIDLESLGTGTFDLFLSLQTPVFESLYVKVDLLGSTIPVREVEKVKIINTAPAKTILVGILVFVTLIWVVVLLFMKKQVIFCLTLFQIVMVFTLERFFPAWGISIVWQSELSHVLLSFSASIGLYFFFLRLKYDSELSFFQTVRVLALMGGVMSFVLLVTVFVIGEGAFMENLIWWNNIFLVALFTVTAVAIFIKAPGKFFSVGLAALSLALGIMSMVLFMKMPFQEWLELGLIIGVLSFNVFLSWDLIMLFSQRSDLKVQEFEHVAGKIKLNYDKLSDKYHKEQVKSANLDDRNKKLKEELVTKESMILSLNKEKAALLGQIDNAYEKESTRLKNLAKSFKAYSYWNKQMEKSFEESFVFLRNKSASGGDFYWYAERKNLRYVVAADPTGPIYISEMLHNVVIASLFELVWQYEEDDPEKMLLLINSRVNAIIGKSDNGKAIPSLNMSIVVVDVARDVLSFGGAKSFVYIARHGKVHRLKGVPFRIGGEPVLKEKSFGAIQVRIAAGDMVYLFTDGMKNQLNLEQGKYGGKRFKDLLLEVSGLPVEIQKENITQEFKKWEDGQGQTDDLLIIGFRY